MFGRTLDVVLSQKPELKRGCRRNFIMENVKELSSASELRGIRI